MADKRKALEAVFDSFDKDRSGKIDASELKLALRDYYSGEGTQVDEAQINSDVQSILSACDTTHDGKIEKAEWFKFFEC